MSNKSKRGFASMDPERQREIASKGGRAAHAKGTAHEWSRDEARTAGRKGGEVVSRDRAHMAAIGREGGEARGRSTARARMLGFSDRESSVSVTREGMPGHAAHGDRATSASTQDEVTR
ncbi:MAG: KGG domain-containing protein [Gemmatimonadaceae bacterium]